LSEPQQKVRFLGQLLAPIWLRGKNAATFIYVWGRLFDRALDGAVAAVKHRFPGYFSFDGLTLSGRERGLRRGIFESDRGYADRLLRWIDSAQVRGSPSEMLHQLYWFHRPELAVATCIIERSGHRYTMTTGTATEAGAIIEDNLAAYNPEAHPERWASYRIVIYGMPVYHTAPLHIQTRALQDLKALVQDFNPARCLGEIIVYEGLGDAFWDAMPAPPGHPEILEGEWDGFDDDDTWDAAEEPFVLPFE
jgi:hypothetical protein